VVATGAHPFAESVGYVPDVLLAMSPVAHIATAGSSARPGACVAGVP
jgi:hypothetical protein